MSLFNFFKRRAKVSASPPPPTVEPVASGDPEEIRVREVVSAAFARGDYRRIYHYHIRKTAGTTINFAFLSESGKAPSQFYNTLTAAPKRRLIANGKVFVGPNRELINEGNYFYAFSHGPMHTLKVPAGTFTITCLRDPVKRLLSHYNMLRHFQVNGIQHPGNASQMPWMGNCFEDFLRNIPRDYLLNQLFMFSSERNVQEAAENIRACSYVLATKTLEKGLSDLEQQLKLRLPISNEKKYNHREEINPAALENLREQLQPEYDLIKLLGKGEVV